MQESFWWKQCSDRYIISPSPLLLIPNKPYGFCGRYAPCLLIVFFFLLLLVVVVVVVVCVCVCVCETERERMIKMNDKTDK